MAWSKRRIGVRYNLARSNAPRLELSELDPDVTDLLRVGKFEDGWQPLLERIAARYGVTPAHVVTTHACSMANHLAFAAVLDPGNEVLLETPVYEPLVSLARYFGARTSFFERRESNAWRIDPDDVRKALTPHTKLVVLSNLHNPSGAFDDDTTINEVVRAAEAVGAFVVIDEVYLDFLHARGVRTAARSAPNVLATRGLTKAFGLDSLRHGWVIAEPSLAERVRRLNDLFSLSTAHVSERLALLAIEQADAIVARAKAVLEPNLEMVDEFVRAQPQLSWAKPIAGTLGLVRAESIDVDDLVERLHRDHEVAVVPGRFFDAPNHFRVSWSLDAADLRVALDRVALALR